MSPRRAVALGVVVWVVVAVAGAALVWGVISRAGDGVSRDIEALPSAEPSGGPRDPSRTPPQQSPTRSPSSSPSSPPTSTPPATSPPVSPAAPVRRTWQDAAGVVSAECSGSAIRITGATSNSGYAVEVDDYGPDRGRVEFETEETRIRVEAECSGGVPVFIEERDD